MKLSTRTLARRPLARPWRRKRPRPYRREVVIVDTPPLAQIDIYADTVILTRRERNGSWRSYPISPEALAQALGRLPITAGLLPEGTIGAGLHQGDPYFIQHIRPHVRRLSVDEGGKAAFYRIALPPLIWAGWRNSYRIFALASTTAFTADTPLAHAPFPNVYIPQGTICWGNVRPPNATSTTMAAALKLFLEDSQFNTHLDDGKSRAAAGGVLKQWRALAKADAPPDYPLVDLVLAGRRLGSLLDGSVWGSR